MKTIFNLFLFIIAFILGLIVVISFKIASFIIGLLFMALIIGGCFYIVALIAKKSLEDDIEDIKKNYKFTDDPRFKEKKEKE